MNDTIVYFMEYLKDFMEYLVIRYLFFYYDYWRRRRTKLLKIGVINYSFFN